MSNSVRPHRRQPIRLPRPWDSTGKNTGVGCHFLLQCVKVKSESEVPQSCLTLATPRTAAHQAPPSMGFSRQECWSGVPLPSPSISSYTSSIQLTSSPSLPHLLISTWNAQLNFWNLFNYFIGHESSMCFWSLPFFWITKFMNKKGEKNPIFSYQCQL